MTLDTPTQNEAEIDLAALKLEAREGDTDALKKLLVYYFSNGEILRYLQKRCSSPQEAEDLASATYLKALVAFTNGNYPKEAFRSWLYRIAHNTNVDYMRKTGGNRRAEFLSEALADSAISVGHTVLSRLTLAEAIPHLTQKQQDVLYYKYVLGHTYPKIAEELGLASDNAVGALLQRAYGALKRLIETPPPKSDTEHR